MYCRHKYPYFVTPLCRENLLNVSNRGKHIRSYYGCIMISFQIQTILSRAIVKASQLFFFLQFSVILSENLRTTVGTLV